MELKGLSTLEWWLTKWLDTHGFEEVSARIGHDFEYDFEDSAIHFAIVLSSPVEDWFYQFITSNFDFPYTCDPFITSFFHELGHNQTYMDFTENEWEKYLEDVNAIAQMDDTEDKNMTYFSLPFEFAATEWAVRYIKDNEDEVKEFWRVCSKLILNIYKQNILKWGGE